MDKYTNECGKECFRNVTPDDEFGKELFHRIPDRDGYTSYDNDKQWALHTNLGSLTVLDRMTGFGYRDVESGYRDPLGNFWLASGDIDVRYSGERTIGEAIEWVKRKANTCIPGETDPMMYGPPHPPSPNNPPPVNNGQ